MTSRGQLLCPNGVTIYSFSCFWVGKAGGAGGAKRISHHIRRLARYVVRYPKCFVTSQSQTQIFTMIHAMSLVSWKRVWPLAAVQKGLK